MARDAQPDASQHSKIQLCQRLENSAGRLHRLPSIGKSGAHSVSRHVNDPRVPSMPPATRRRPQAVGSPAVGWSKAEITFLRPQSGSARNFMKTVADAHRGMPSLFGKAE